MGGNRAEACIAFVLALTLSGGVAGALAMQSPVPREVVAAAPRPLVTPTVAASSPAPQPTPKATAAVRAPALASVRPTGPARATGPARPEPPSLLGQILFVSDRGVAARPQPQSPDGTVTPTSEGLNVWVMNDNGSGQRRLTTTGFDSQPALSPDGRRVAWVHGNDQLWAMSSDRSGARRLVQCPLACQDPRWSPDGRQIAYVTVDKTAQAQGHAMVMRADGTGTRAIAPELNAYMATWSPDGRRMAIAVGLDGKNNGLYITDPTTGRATRIYGQDGYAPHAPDWSPDGSSILLGDGTNLFTIRPDGTELRQLTGNPDRPLVEQRGQYLSGAWSRDGQTIAFDFFGGTDESKGQIGVMRADGTGIRLLTDQTADCGSPRY